MKKLDVEASILEEIYPYSSCFLIAKLFQAKKNYTPLFIISQETKCRTIQVIAIDLSMLDYVIAMKNFSNVLMISNSREQTFRGRSTKRVFAQQKPSWMSSLRKRKTTFA